jgi:hypothetical protein
MGYVTRSWRAGTGAGAIVAMLLAAESEARGEQPRIDRYDVPTVFYIAKSDDGSRVDYGIHLDEHCAPQNNDAIFLYWRELDNHPVTTHTLGTFEYIPYGVWDQRVVRKTATGGEYLVRLRQFKDSPIEITTQKEADGHCSSLARMTINRQTAQLLYVWVKLTKGFPWPSVSFVDVHGKDLTTGQDVVQRIMR